MLKCLFPACLNYPSKSWLGHWLGELPLKLLGSVWINLLTSFPISTRVKKKLACKSCKTSSALDSYLSRKKPQHLALPSAAKHSCHHPQSRRWEPEKQRSSNNFFKIGYESAQRFEWVQGFVQTSSISTVSCLLMLNILMRKSSEHAAAARCRNVTANVPKPTSMSEQFFPQVP